MAELTPATEIRVRIADSIRGQIEDGTLKAGEQLPPAQAIADEWRTSLGSARAAIALLRGQGLITSGRGKPPSVRMPRRLVIRDSRRHQAEKNVATEPELVRRQHGEAEDDLGLPLEETDFRADYQVIKAPPPLAEVFGIEPETEVVRKTYETRDTSGWTRFAYSVSYVPVFLIEGDPKLLDVTEEPWPGGAQHQLRSVGIEISDIIDEVTAVAPTTVDTQRWSLEHGVPLLLVRRISIDTLGRVVEVSDAQYPADRTKLRFRTSLTPWEK